MTRQELLSVAAQRLLKRLESHRILLYTARKFFKEQKLDREDWLSQCIESSLKENNRLLEEAKRLAADQQWKAQQSRARQVDPNEQPY